jgi:hypothetical protein
MTSESVEAEHERWDLKESPASISESPQDPPYSGPFEVHQSAPTTPEVMSGQNRIQRNNPSCKYVVYSIDRETRQNRPEDENETPVSIYVGIDHPITNVDGQMRFFQCRTDEQEAHNRGISVYGPNRWLVRSDVVVVCDNTELVFIFETDPGLNDYVGSPGKAIIWKPSKNTHYEQELRLVDTRLVNNHNFEYRFGVYE